MADNFLERQYADYQARRAAADRARKLKWQKQLKAYKESLRQQSSGQQSATDSERLKDNPL